MNATIVGIYLTGGLRQYAQVNMVGVDIWEDIFWDSEKKKIHISLSQANYEKCEKSLTELGSITPLEIEIRKA